MPLGENSCRLKTNEAQIIRFMACGDFIKSKLNGTVSKL